MKISLYFHTLIHLRPKQIYYRLFYNIRAWVRKNLGINYALFISAQSYPIILKNSISSKQSYFSQQNRFEFLHQSQIIPINKINWNDEKIFGKLWVYNLNYFDFLNQENITKAAGLQLVEEYIQDAQNLNIGFEPYPMSLRGINWIKFLRKYQVQYPTIGGFLMAQYVRLSNNLEYHLMGNHLLENAFSLLFGAYYFRNEGFLISSYKILREELPEQILADGGHFERSPMYHQILLFRLLDCLNLVRNNKDFADDNFEQLLIFYAQKMVNFLQNITFKNGDIPLLNDAAKNIAPTTKQLVVYANQLNIRPQRAKLGESGYRKFGNDTFELFVDVGDISPDYQPAHAHCDTLSFVLYAHGKPFIVDTGTSTYENNEIRYFERSTAAHNTVQIENFEQSTIWASFRVGRKAKAKILAESEGKIIASHDGYKNLGIIHERGFFLENHRIIIQDKIIGATHYIQKAYLHFYPGIEIHLTGNTVTTDFGCITFENIIEIKESEYLFSEEFNQRKPAKLLTLLFQKHITTILNFRQPP